MANTNTATKCKGCDRTEERTERGIRKIQVNSDGICRACAESAAEMKDELNPAYMFQTIPTALLVRIARGELNVLKLAKQELANRGQDIRTGKWVGFPAAAESAKLHATVGPTGKTTFVSIPE